jgi:Na+/H+ antiporter NhaD/arsenite permease-like protein
MSIYIFLLSFSLNLKVPCLPMAYTPGLLMSSLYDQRTADNSTAYAAPGMGENHAREQTAAEGHSLPPIWLMAPFLVLLCMIATGPVLYESFWHHHYPKVALFLAGFVVAYYIGILKDSMSPLEAFMDYIQFIALISALYMAAGSMLITINQPTSPSLNVMLLFSGAILANLIGTTGASMLLIRPYVRLNQAIIKPYHIVFFIFIISNLGGALTPMGDPPLFLGFLKGVPFCWTLQHNVAPWLIAIGLLLLLFWAFDCHNTRQQATPLPSAASFRLPIITIVGKRNVGWLFLMILTVFIDPSIFSWVPTFTLFGHSFSFIRELLLFSFAWASYRFANPLALQMNDFSLAPIKEVAWLFVGIFFTMIPALRLISNFAQSPLAMDLITPHTLYWATGSLSAVLDNAPTYLNFLAASMGSQGADISQAASVAAYATGKGFVNSILHLKAISLGAVFFGAMTYIGNGPNFMVKSIAERLGVSMPSFLAYIFRFTIPLLLPVLFLIWIVTFYFQWL